MLIAALAGYAALDLTGRISTFIDLSSQQFRVVLTMQQPMLEAREGRYIKTNRYLNFSFFVAAYCSLNCTVTVKCIAIGWPFSVAG